MGTPNTIYVKARDTAVSGRYQAEIEPNRVYSVKGIAQCLAERMAIRPSVAEGMILCLEELIIDQLAEGNQLNFNLASFYPRLSGALSSRDADPASDGLFVRGAVKAKRPLVNGLNRRVVAENRLSSTRTHLYVVVDETAHRENRISQGHLVSLQGGPFPIVEGREDEGVWLERRKGKAGDRVARARIVKSDHFRVECVFDEIPACGSYYVVIQTRMGRDVSLKPIRARQLVRVVGA